MVSYHFPTWSSLCEDDWGGSFSCPHLHPKEDILTRYLETRSPCAPPPKNSLAARSCKYTGLRLGGTLH